jgi:hypothetical protein
MNRKHAQTVTSTIGEEVKNWPIGQIEELLESKQARTVRFDAGVDYSVVIETTDESTTERLIHLIVLADDGTLSAIRPETLGRLDNFPKTEDITSLLANGSAFGTVRPSSTRTSQRAEQEGSAGGGNSIQCAGLRVISPRARVKFAV